MSRATTLLTSLPTSLLLATGCIAAACSTVDATLAIPSSTADGGTASAQSAVVDAAKVSAPEVTKLKSPLEIYFEDAFGVGLATVFWGDLHTHTFYSADADLQNIGGQTTNVVTPATVYERARSRGFSFSAVADHAEAPVPENIAPGSGANVWESTRTLSKAVNDESADANGVFIPFMGYEYTNPFPCLDPSQCPASCSDQGSSCNGTCSGLGGEQSCAGYGHKNVVFASLDGAPAQRLSFLDPAAVTVTTECDGADPSPYCGFSSYSAYAPTNPSAWTWLREHGYAPTSIGASALTIIHTPGNIHHVDWGVIDTDFVRNVEIFSQWGNSEGPAPKTCSVRRDLDVKLPQELANDDALLIRPQIADKWLNLGDARYALSFVGGSDDHSGNPGGDGIGNGGITGLVTPRAGRAEFFQALYARRTIAATYYQNMEPLVALTAVETGGHHFFGGDIGTIDPSGKVVLRILASSSTEQLQVVVDGCTVSTTDASSLTTPLTLLPTARHYVYVRARRKSAAGDAGSPATDYHQTWSSPIYLRPAGT